MNIELVIRCVCLAVGIRIAFSALRRREPIAVGASDGVLVGLGQLLGQWLRPAIQSPKVIDSVRVFAVGQTSSEGLAGWQVVCFLVVTLLAACALQLGGLVVAPGCVAAIFLSPAIPLRLLEARVSRARRAVRDVLPQALELTAAWMASGQSLEAALEFLSTSGPVPLRALACDAQSRIHQGVNPTMALRQSAVLSGIDELSRVAASLDRARQLGAPAAESLHDCATSLRSLAHTALVRRAGRAGPAATLITAMVVAPACVGLLAILMVGGTAVGFGR